MDRANDKLLYAQSKLEHSLQREVDLMRDFLASLEEERLLLHDRKAKALRDLMVQRQVLLDKLLAVRILREEHVTELGRLLGISQMEGQGESPLFLSALLEEEALDGCTLLALRDQLLALMEKVGELLVFNESLLEKNPISQEAWKEAPKVQIQRAVKRSITRSSTALATLPEQKLP